MLSGQGRLELKSEGGKHAGSGDGGGVCMYPRTRARGDLFSKGSGQKRLAGQWSFVVHSILKLAVLDSHVPETQPC